MELDDLKQALTRLDKRFEAQEAVDLANARRAQRNRAADGLRPLARGQIGLIVSGAITAFIGVAAWHGAMDRSLGGPFVAGIIFHAYGVAMIMIGAITRGLLWGIDWAGPVVGIQQRLARVRRARVLAGLTIGLSWCMLWVPALIVLFFLAFGVDIVAPSPATWLWISAGNAALMAAVGLFYFWASATGRSAITSAFGRAFAGEHLVRAQADLAAIGAFERD